ncbi:adenylate/guanylate cyclase domain-containing protein [Bradyrhizobium sp.]|uniref:adenylate/guanylate cyclase domain-containing protein n=1 Tax=Bradyrhizobium sp. TaxID=376 RepID=UPI002D4A5C74|nr:tetratricopeptide repeat protein [Bradyrhizobium sp.]HZR76497.1 tetratricopeptide repeat protein [Bradyrhizobium sp.]
MSGERVERRLAAVLAGAVDDYSRLIHADEEAVLTRLKTVRQNIVVPSIAAHRGRIVKTVGDSMLAEFASTVDAARCAVEVQRAMAAQNTGKLPQVRIEFRIGLHVGDVIVDDNDIFGDCVNIAARLQGLAEPCGLCLSDDAFRQIRGKIELVCDDLGLQRLKNIAEPVRVWRVAFGDGLRFERKGAAIIAPASQLDAEAALELPAKPSIAVLPFENMSEDREQDYFADGLVEDIITALSRFKSLFVIARNSSFAYKGKAIDIKAVGRELGVRYVLEGSVRKAGERLRITGQLIDAATGAQLWAEKFDGPMTDVFELQDQVASAVAGVIDPLLLDTEIRRALEQPTSDLTAYHLYLRSLPHIRAWTREDNLQAIALLEQAVERDPRYGMALASLALCHAHNLLNGWAGDAATARELTITWARRALEAAPDDPSTVTSSAGALMNTGENIETLKRLVDGALARNPSHAFGWMWSGWMRTLSGESELAIRHFETSLRLDPRASRKAFHLTGISMCHFFEQRFDEACRILEISFNELPSYSLTAWFLTAAYSRMGRLDEAREFAQRQGIAPGGPWLAIGRLLVNAAHRDMALSALRAAIGEHPAS